MKKIKIFYDNNKFDQSIETNQKLINNKFANSKFIKKRACFKYLISIHLIIFILLIMLQYTGFKLYKKTKRNATDIKILKNIFQKYLIKMDLIKNIENYSLEKYIRDSIVWPLPKEIKYIPRMTLKETIAFCYFMKPGNIYFEFGSGGSTNVASYYKIKTYSVESDIKWHNSLKASNIRANYITIDLKANYYGYPGKESNIKDWKKYIQAYKSEYNADIILLDGRFRVACGLDIFNKIRNDTIILIHDYTFRKQYHILENYYLKLKTFDTLVAFIKKPNSSLIPKNIFNKYLKKKYL